VRTLPLNTAPALDKPSRFVVLSGCSGGGKSSLLEELRRRGYGVVTEPGRRIVQAELESGGQILPWLDIQAFARRAMEVACADLAEAAKQQGWVFFDRGLVDAAAAWEHATGESVPSQLSSYYHPNVFLTPPWPEIFETDHERRHGFTEAENEFERLHEIYNRLGYKTTLLPKTAVETRADLVLTRLGI
jgi:predicted ATPase